MLNKGAIMSEQDFLEMINETEPEVVIFGIRFGAGDILKEMDPIAFRVMFSDYTACFEE